MKDVGVPSVVVVGADGADDDVGAPSVVVVGADGADDDIVNPRGTLTSNGANR